MQSALGQLIYALFLCCAVGGFAALMLYVGDWLLPPENGRRISRRRLRRQYRAQAQVADLFNSAEQQMAKAKRESPNTPDWQRW